MAAFKLDIEKEWQGELWTNVYYLDGESSAGLLDEALGIVEIERAVHKSIVTFTKFRVSSQVEGDEDFRTQTLNLAGLAPVNSEVLPLFNVVRVDISAETGRPSRKYLRLPIGEGEQLNGRLEPGFITFVNTSYSDPLSAFPSLRDVDGQQLIAASTNPNVAMRQLRRGSRRRSQPVIP